MILLDRSHYTNGTFYILKDDSELKKVILKLNVSNPYTFGIRYGEQERHYIKSFLFSLAFGVVLAIPNIIAQIYMFCIKERQNPRISFLLNIILNFAYGNLFSYLLHFGVEASLYVGAVAMGIFFLVFFGMICKWCDCERKIIFEQLYTSLKDFEELPILEEIIDKNRRKPPTIKINAKSGHKESREVLKEYHLMKQVTFNDIHFGGYYYDSTNYNFALFDTQYSEWKRVDEGGGKIKGKQGDEFKKFVKDVETKNVEIWNKESEYKYGS